MCKILTKKIICACTRELVWLKDWRLHKSANVVSGELPLGKAESEGTQKKRYTQMVSLFFDTFLTKSCRILAYIKKLCYLCTRKGFNIKKRKVKINYGKRKQSYSDW